jgi:hypothetical protein
MKAAKKQEMKAAKSKPQEKQKNSILQNLLQKSYHMHHKGP